LKPPVRSEEALSIQHSAFSPEVFGAVPGNRLADC
jgi:hypothetical protein